MRGLPRERKLHKLQPRIIPARAGFTGVGGVGGFGVGDHPRACGVYSCSASFRLTMSGSSPRVRGLPVYTSSHARAAGIIPARAGFTICRFRGRHIRRDHPRACGVYAQKLSNECTRAGSSPRVRGLHSHICLLLVGGGIIPARAGFTIIDHYYMREIGDHPRACGVYPSGCGPWGST